MVLGVSPCQLAGIQKYKQGGIIMKDDNPNIIVPEPLQKKEDEQETLWCPIAQEALLCEKCQGSPWCR